MARVLIFGTGSVGAVYSYVCSKGNAVVSAICRSNYAAAKEHGFSISSQVFGEVSVHPAVFRSVAEAKGPFDFVVICAKVAVGLTPSTAELIKPAVDPSTAIVLCQNGIGIEDEYAKAYPKNPVISGVVYLPTTQVAPGKINMGNLERLEIGTYPADATKISKDRTEEFRQLFSAGGATCNVFEDIQVQRWSKLMVNASWNPICALTLLDDANFIRSSDEAGEMVKNVMLEVVSVANAKGYHQISEKDAEWQFSRAKARLNTGGIEPSMLTDVRFGRNLEVEALVGNTIRIAREVGVQTPLLTLIYVLASGLNKSIAMKGS